VKIKEICIDQVEISDENSPFPIEYLLGIHTLPELVLVSPTS